MTSGGAESNAPAVDGQTILACQTTLVDNCVIEIPEIDEIVAHPAKILKTTVIGIEDLTHDIKRIRLSLPKSFEFSPGQYATLQFTPQHVRPYSMAVTANAEEVEFHIRLVRDGRVTSYVEKELAVGQSVRLSGPLGTAYLRKKYAGPIVCIAGGTGLAPILSILRGMVETGMRNPVHIYFGVRSEQDIYGLHWLEELREAIPELTVHVVVASGQASNAHRTGVVTEAVNQDWKNMSGWRAYLAGAPVMVEAATILLRQKGVEPDHIYADAFYASGV